MKCLCGYEYLHDWEGFDDGVSPKMSGDSEFIELKEVMRQHRSFQSDAVYKLFICPACGTVKSWRVW